MNLIGVNSIGAIIAFLSLIWYIITGVFLYCHIDKKYIKKSAKFRRLRIKMFSYKNLIPIRNRFPQDKKYTKLICHQRISLTFFLIYIILYFLYKG